MKLVKGTRFIEGKEAQRRRRFIDTASKVLADHNFNEIVLPTLEFADTFLDKIGTGTESQMYTFPDKKGRLLCLRPEGTATLQKMYNSTGGRIADERLWYVTQCFRYETPQKGRYREFTQIGVEILGPREDYLDELIELAKLLVMFAGIKTHQYEVNTEVERGLSYYTRNGFEFTAPSLGAQKQILGGGEYPEGIGFAIGLDRLLLV